MEIKDLEKALDDIHFVKEIISNQTLYYKNFIRSKGIRYLSLFFGLFMLLLFVGIFYSIKTNIIKINSLNIKWLVLILIILISLIGGYVKYNIWNNMFPDKPWPNIFFKIMGLQILKIFITLILLVLTLTTLLIILKHYQYILIAWGFGVGILYLLFGTFFYSMELEITGYWFIIASVLSILFITTTLFNAYLWTGLIFGIGFILFYITSTLYKIQERKRSE